MMKTLLCVLFTIPMMVCSQDKSESSVSLDPYAGTPLQRNLKSWDTSNWLDILHRGVYDDDVNGFIHDYDERMDDSYWIDKGSYDFSMMMDAEYHKKENGLRAWIGSINTTRFFTLFDMKVSHKISDDYVFRTSFHREEDYQSEHNVVLMSLHRTNLYFDGLSVFTEFTVQSNKEDLDLKLGALWAPNDLLNVELSVTALDFLVNVLHGGKTGVPKNQRAFKLSYKFAPVAFRGSVKFLPGDGWNLELLGVSTTLQRYNKEFHEEPKLDFERKAQALYWGVLLEKKINDQFVVGAMLKDYYGQDDMLPLNNGDGFELEERNTAASLYSFYRWSEGLFFETEAVYTMFDFIKETDLRGDIELDTQDWDFLFSIESFYSFHKNFTWINSFFVNRHVMDRVKEDVSLDGTNVRYKIGIIMHFHDKFRFVLTNNIGLENLGYEYDGSSAQLMMNW